MNVLPQPDAQNRPLDPFEAAMQRDRPRRTESSHGDSHSAGAIDIGCVDWYLYQVNRKERQPEGSRNARPGAAAALAGEDHSA